MYSRQVAVYFGLAVFVCSSIAFLFYYNINKVAAYGCPTGTVPITSATRAQATAASIPTSSMCWNPNDQNVGTDAGTAKAWLKQHATSNSNIACMNATYAEKLMKFMQAVPGGTPTITDGYRDPSKQAALVASGASHAGACQSYHNYGLASDFNNNTKQQTAWMRANASSYGIGHIGGWDPNHFQDANGRTGQCGSCSNTGAGSGGSLPAYSPVGGQPELSSTPDDVQPYTPTKGTQCDQGYVMSGSQCVISSQNTQPSDSTGSTGTATTSTALASNTNTNTNNTANDTASTTTTTNLSNNPNTTTSVIVTTQTALNTNTSQATITDTGTTNASNSTTNVSTSVSGDTIVTTQPTVAAGQSLTAQDQSASNAATNMSSSYNSNGLSSAQQTLQNLTTILQGLLSYLATKVNS